MDSNSLIFELYQDDKIQSLLDALGPFYWDREDQFDEMVEQLVGEWLEND
tara:strand:+ start:1625 stop:1774 length:150 start_codon:yes stop_codon:yes gene_type:complete